MNLMYYDTFSWPPDIVDEEGNVHCTNLTRGVQEVHIHPEYGSLLDWWPLTVDAEAAMRETVRLYGEHFGVLLKESAPYRREGRWDLGPSYYSLWFKHGRHDISRFWRLYESVCVEVAKA